jgi:hypothetical protein
MQPTLLVVLGFLAPGLIQAQERWQRLPGAASSYQVDLRLLSASGGVLRARIQTPDVGNVVSVQEIEVRCATHRARTIARKRYDNDTGRPVAESEPPEPDTLWISYPSGSEGHALLAGLCALGRQRKLLGMQPD